MQDGTTLARVCAIIGDALGKGTDEIDPTATLEVIGLDSMERVQLGLDLESHFGFDLEEQEHILGDLDTPQAIATAIEPFIGRASPAPFVISTLDPRFDADGQVTVNGYLFERVR
jgi:acyl carrier protein